MNNIAVIMSTYNGEKYLREQLDSILNQAGVEVSLFIRDDGSSDGTKAILSEYVDRFDNVKVEFAENVGVGNSFMNALYATPDTFNYYAFADQDDIWLPEKLFEAVKMLESSGKMLYVSNQENVDKQGNSLGLRWETDDKRIFLTPVGIIGNNVLCGCTMVMNSEFAKLICEQSRRPSEAVLKVKNHDGWIAVVAAIYDGIVYDNRSFIKYRQHGNNVVGAYNKKLSFGKKLKIKLNKMIKPKLRCYRSNTARELCKIYKSEVKKYSLIEICANSKKIRGKKHILENSETLRNYTGEKKSTFYLKVIFGLF